MGLQRGSRVRAFAGGVLCANSLGHLASAAAGKEHLTPLAGRRSGPAVNAVWGLLNLGGGLLLGRAAAPPHRRAAGGVPSSTPSGPVRPASRCGWP